MLCSKLVVASGPMQQQVRCMATLKDISMRLKSVKNIQKITKSMKMVAAAKYSQAERQLKPARPYGAGAKSFYESAEFEANEEKPNHLVVMMTSDRGLCGGVHSNIVKQVKHDLADKLSGKNVKLICVGDKSRMMLQRLFPKDFLMSFSDIGKRPPTFEDATTLAMALLDTDYKYDVGDLYYNRFKTVVSYRTETLPIFSVDSIKESDKLGVFDSVDNDVLQSYLEFSLASLIYYALKEASCSEQSSRMTAMDAASKNAGEMIDKLTLTFNRTRQAVITRELIEIISGAAAV